MGLRSGIFLFIVRKNTLFDGCRYRENDGKVSMVEETAMLKKIEEGESAGDIT
jgi:hypothetical protein